MRSTLFSLFLYRQGMINLGIFLALSFGPLRAQEAINSPLYKVVTKLDSLLFQVGFNTCDLSPFDLLVSENFEFYHDQSDPILNKQDFMDNTENGLCNMDYQALRYAIPGTTEVFALFNDGQLYGAFQLGSHKFYAEYPGKRPFETSIAEYAHLWIIEEDNWKLSRVWSYNHSSPGDDSANDVPESLKQTAEHLDEQLFDLAFNQCDFQLWESLVSRQLEFYDDRTGPNKDIDKEIRSFRDRCGSERHSAVLREFKLKPGRIYALQDYGFIQMGIHDFYSNEGGQTGNRLEQSRFFHMWKREKNGWQVYRVISYDHQKVE